MRTRHWKFDAPSRRSSSDVARHSLVALALLALPVIAQAQPRPFGNVGLQELIGNVINVVMGLIGSLSLAMFVWGGFVWMTARGSEEQVKKAKNILLYSTLGILATFLSFAAVRFILTSIETIA